MKQYTILLVDDELINLQKLIDAIIKTNRNYKILSAKSAEMAINIISKEVPDIIITDWDMPVMNGIEMIRIIKQQPELSDIPIIMCTGVMTTSQNLETALDAGAIDFIRKPIDDIELSARIRSSLKLSDSYKKIKELNHTKDKFFSIIAHDLRTPFAGIIGFVDLLIDDYQSFDQDKIMEVVKLLKKSSGNAYKLLENLLEWAKAQTGKIEFNPQTVRLKSIVTDVVGIAAGSGEAKNISIHHEISEKIQIFADINMLQTILRNLIINAIKFTYRNGTVHVFATENPKYIDISVVDNGVGMKPEKIMNLFSINEKTSTLGTEKEEGTGLGLVLCKEFVEKHGGKILVESEVEHGSRFTVSLPKM